MPRKVTCSAKVGVLTNSSSTPAALAYWREWARKMLRLQKPVPWVPLTAPAACAGPPSSMPGPAAMVIVVAAAAPFRKRRREAVAAPEKSISESLGKCVQPMRSHMTCPPRSANWESGFFSWRCSCPDDSLPAVANDNRHRNCRHANRREPLMRPALRGKGARAVPSGGTPRGHSRLAGMLHCGRSNLGQMPKSCQILFASRR